MLYELVTGRLPFTGETSSDVLVAILDREPAPMASFDPQMPNELQRIVSKALRKDREQRYQTVKDMRLDLEALRTDLQSGSSVAISTPTPPMPTASTIRQSSAEYLVTQLQRHKAVAAMATLVALGAIAAAGWWAFRTVQVRQAQALAQTHAAPSVQRKLTRLTFGSGLQTDATFSPDGRFIGYASDSAGNFDIWVQPVAGGNPVQVTKSPAQDTQPDWSPDGSTIVFRSERGDGGLFAVPALGGQERQLTSFGVHPTWSQDGSEVIFLVGPNVDSGGGPARCYTVSLDGGEPREVGAAFLSQGTWNWIAGHPDGRLSALGTHRKLGTGFFTFSRTGEHAIQSTLPADLAGVAGGGSERFHFHWNGAGTALYLELTRNALQSLWRASVDPATLEWRGLERLTTGGATSDVAATLSHDGKRLVFTTEQSSTRLWVFPFDATIGRVTGAPKAITPAEGSAEVPALSPDGRTVVYEFKRPGIDRAELWATHLEDGTSQIIATNAGTPTWSRDGRQLAYMVGRSGKLAVATRALDGVERVITDWRAEGAPVPTGWTPDESGVIGSLVTINADRTPLKLWSVSGTGGRAGQALISQPGTNIWQASYSPNGRWISFEVARTAEPGRSGIAVSPATGGPPEAWTRIATDHTWPDKPRWAPDGRTLYFISRRPGSFFNLWGVRFDPDHGVPTATPFVITRFDSPSQMILPYMDRAEVGIAPRRLVLPMMTVNGSIWMLDDVDK